MTRSSFSCSFIVLGLVGLLADPAGQGIRREFAHSRIDVQARAEQPAGAPIILTLKLTNTGEETIHYRVDEGGVQYPTASWFKAHVTDGNGNVEEVKMSNDSHVDLLGTHSFSRNSILPGQSITFPAVIHPWPAGVYIIQLNGQRAQVRVKDDEQLAQKWTQEMLGKIRKGDRFAEYVARTYPTHALTEALLQDLSSDDVPAAGRATEILGRLQSLPDNSLPYIKKAIKKKLTLAKQGRLMTGEVPFGGLAYFASEIGTDEALALVLEVARTDKFRSDAIAALGNFKQEAAAKELHRFLSDPDEHIQFRAAQALAKRTDKPAQEAAAKQLHRFLSHPDEQIQSRAFQALADRKDKAALEALLIVAKDPNSRWRRYAFEPLEKFSDDPRVEPAIKSGLTDPDWRVRQYAERALRDLARLKKQKP